MAVATATEEEGSGSAAAGLDWEGSGSAAAGLGSEAVATATGEEGLGLAAAGFGWQAAASGTNKDGGTFPWTLSSPCWIPDCRDKECDIWLMTTWRMDSLRALPRSRCRR